MLMLYTDDDIDDHKIFEEILEEVAPNAKCINAYDGAEVLEILEKLIVLPDIVFLDINMPIMDGKSCLKILKRDSRFLHIPVCIYTTSANEKDRIQCMQLGAEWYLIKPYALKEAKKVIADTLKRF